MPEGASVVNLGDLTKPATILIEKVSDAVGGIFRPSQIRRVAQAEADADMIKAVAQLEITELQRRAAERFFAEETIKQANMEAIAQKALPQLRDDAHPEQVENDWFANFLDKCRLISDEEMQALWSRLLAGEANTPGHFSKRTVNTLASMDKSDAELFKALCSFVWMIGERPYPFIYDYSGFDLSVYTACGINFESLNHLDDIGLISYSDVFAVDLVGSEDIARVSYFGELFDLWVPIERRRQLGTGRVAFSKAGEELSRL
jgi:hypothetical protein